MSWWPFGRQKEKSASPPSVELTEDERQECESFIRSMTKAEGGEYYFRKEVADSVQRSFIAMCLIGRAQRFAILADPQKPELVDEACRAGAKACSIYPLSVNFYGFACVLEQLRKLDESKAMFKEFLRQRDLESSPDPVQQSVLRAQDIAGMTRHARQQLE